MSVEAFTVDGKVTIDTTPFESGIAKVTTQLSELSGSMKSMMEMGGGNWNFNGALNGLKTLKDDIAVIKQDIATMNTEFSNTQGIDALKTQITSLREEIEKIKGKINEIGSVAQENVTKVSSAIDTAKQKTLGWSEQIAKVTEGIVSLMSKEEFSNYILEQQESEIGQINARWRETQGLVEKNTAFMKEMAVSGSNVAKYFIRETELLESSLNFINQKNSAEQKYNSAVSKSFSALIRQSEELEKQVMLTQKRATALGQVGREIIRQGNEIKKNLTYEEEMIATENLFKNGLAEEMSLYAEQVQLQEQIRAINESDMAIRNGVATNVKDILAMTDEELALLREELALEEQILGVEKQQTSEQKRQNSTRTQGNDLDKMSYLPRRIGSMALTMWGFNELMDVYDKTMGHINAESQKDYFAKRMGMDSKATQDFTNQLNNMQKTYKKLDMTVVGANALETATKYKVQESSLGDLTEVMAIYGSEFVKQGRSQEDSILAINDALDGELRRLKEVGIGAEELEATGLWNGDESDKEGMLKALLQIAQERGYDKTAKDITNLSDAITTLEVKLSIDLARAFGVIEPLITDVLGNFVTMLEALEGAIAWVTPKITEFAKALGLIDKDGNGTKFGNFLEDWASWMITFGITAYGVYKIIKPLVGWLKNLRGATDDVAKTTGDIGNDVGKTMNTGGFKENFKSEWGKLGKNLGKMARVFVEFAVALAMAWALIEEAILLISAIGYTYESLKPQFDSGIEFIKEFGIWFALLGGAMLVLSYALDKVPESTMQGITKGATKLAYGMAIAIGLVTEAIGLLIAPMLAIALLGGTASFLGTNLDKGLEVISWIGNALHQIDLPVALFIGGFLAISLLLGLVQPLTLALAVGIASALLLVTEAIVMLIPPLGAIALLGGTASMLGEDKIQQGADALKIVAQALKTIAEAVPYLLVVDIGVLGQELMDWGSKLITGKDGLSYLSEEIIPNLSEFVSSFNGVTIDPIDTTTVANLSQVASQLPSIKSSIDTIRNSVGNGGTGGMNIFGFQIGGDTSSLKPKLDTLYESIKDVMDFANKLGNLSTTTTGGVTSVNAISSAVTQLQAKLRSMVTVINTASVQVKASAKGLGSGITQGFKTGSASFGATVVSVLAKGVSEIQSRYATFNNGGKTLGQKMIDGFKNHKPSLKTITSREISYALTELDNAKDDFYTKGKALGSELTRGYEDGADIHSPGLIARTTSRELRYTMDALTVGERMMYQGGVALGQALTNGYNSYGNLRTDVGVLASKGVSNEQLQANAKNTQLNGNQKGQNPQLTQTNINIDMSNSTVIGVQDLDNKIRQAVEKAIVSINSPNGAIGY